MNATRKGSEKENLYFLNESWNAKLASFYSIINPPKDKITHFLSDLRDWKEVQVTRGRATIPVTTAVYSCKSL